MKNKIYQNCNQIFSNSQKITKIKNIKMRRISKIKMKNNRNKNRFQKQECKMKNNKNKNRFQCQKQECKKFQKPNS